MGNVASAISRMSIRARVAFGLVCAERAFRHFAIREAVIDQLLKRLWSYTDAERLDSWGCRWEAAELIDEFGEGIPRAHGETVAHLLEALDEIGGGNLFGGFKNEFTLEPALKLVAILDEHGVPLPPLKPFIRVSPRRFWSAWGRRFTFAELQELL